MNPSRTCISILAGAVAMLGCAQPRLEFVGAYEPNLAPDCTWDGTTGDVPLVAGAMNASLARSYLLVMKLEIGNNSGPGARDSLLVREAELSYACKDTAAKCAGFVSPKPAVVPLALVVAAEGESAVMLSLFTDEAVLAVGQWATSAPATIVAGVRFRGDFGESETIDFPVLVYSKAADPCPQGTVPSFSTCQAVFGTNGDDQYACQAPP